MRINRESSPQPPTPSQPLVPHRGSPAPTVHDPNKRTWLGKKRMIYPDWTQCTQTPCPTPVFPSRACPGFAETGTGIYVEGEDYHLSQMPNSRGRYIEHPVYEEHYEHAAMALTNKRHGEGLGHVMCALCIIIYHRLLGCVARKLQKMRTR